MTILRFLGGMVAIWLLAIILSNTVFADHYSVEKLNQQVDSTNFIVGAGQGHCSGTLIDKGYRLILTNHHCIDMYVRKRDKEVVTNGVIKKIQVEDLLDATVSQKSYADHKLVGEASWQAIVVARWKESDLALLQIKAESIPNAIATPVFAGDKVQRATPVFAIGNPHMLDSTVSSGIVSNAQRTLRVRWADNQPVSFIQTTAPIAGGSSGGSLVLATPNKDGLHELIGVPAAGTSAGDVGLAIPFYRIQEFLTENCWKEVWDKSLDVESHDTCVKRKEKEAEED